MPIMDFESLCKTLPVRYCPRCGHEALRIRDAKAVCCNDCGFLYFHNNAAATGVVIRCDDYVLFIERGLEPSKGLLDLPGGFVDYGETLEEAAIRETREEVGLELSKIEYLVSFPNVYRYRDVIYQTCDIYFQARLTSRPKVEAGDDAAACFWRRPCEIAPGEAAFDSVRGVLSVLRRQD